MLILILSAAFAEESTFEGAKTPATAPTRDTQASAEMGGMLAFGNTETMSLTGQGTASHRWKKNQVGGTFAVNWGQSRLDTDGDGKLNDAERAAPFVQTAEREQVTVRYDRFIGRRDSVYGLVGAFSDTFAGYEWRANGQLGVAHVFLERETTALRGELGVDVAREDFVEGIEPNAQTVVSARALLGIRHAFNKHVAIEDNVEVYENLVALDDVRVYNTAAVTASVASRIALKISHQLAFDNVPVEGYQPLDHTTLATVVFTVI